MILPIATRWVAMQETKILEAGEELTPAEKKWAANVGVEDVDKVRVLVVPKIKVPLMGEVIGLAAQYGVYINSDFRTDPSLLVHELTHVAQYERLGGIRPFIIQYFTELSDPICENGWSSLFRAKSLLHEGYQNAAMEYEARDAAIPFNRPPDI